MSTSIVPKSGNGNASKSFLANEFGLDLGKD
jgi:hypothetical protein